ncbi:MAG: alpha/beta hydrolase [Gammaproteobacteria bacterium]|nr:alpha/beta hydrolase [Gammaproteobacteria bacterium]
MTIAQAQFTNRQKHLFLDGLASSPLKVAYTDMGSGEPVVLLHGIPTWSYLYADVIPLLTGSCRIIAPDFLGHGNSDQRDCFDRSLTAQTAMLLKFLDRLEIDRVNLVGHDTGGGVALIMAIEHPDRLRRVVLSNIVAYDSWPIDDMHDLGKPSMARRPVDEIIKFIAGGLNDGLHNADRLTPEFREGILAPYASEVGKISLVRNASALNTNHTMALVDRHKDISTPTKLIWGVHDPWQTIADGEQLAREIPGAELQRVDNASHWIPQDTPDRFAEGVQTFLS